MRPVVFLASILLLCTSAASTCAATASEPYVPEQLKPWVDWVLHAHPDHACPREHANGSITDCQWTRSLDVDVSSSELTFVLQTTLFAAADVILPGDERFWPQNVNASGRDLVVTRTAGSPAVRLAAGSYTISGRITWLQRPEGIELPRQFGLLAFSLDDERIMYPTVNNGFLLFGERQAPEAVRETDSLEIDVYRLLIDENPMLMRVVLELRVGGRSRPEKMGRLLPGNFSVIQFDSKLPARLDADGNLNIQVEAGEFTVEVLARATDQPADFRMLRATDNWPEQEIWAFDPRRNLRLADLSGAPGVDLKQVQAPFEGDLLGFLLNPASTLSIRTGQRGDPTPVPNEFALQRDLWLNFDGAGLIVRDQLDATITQATRLSATYPLGRISVNDENELITRISTGEPGIELQNGHYRIESVSALETTDNLSATGWNVDAQTLQATLHLPPGWRLLWAGGVDAAPGSWIARWTLWDIFLITLTLVLSRRFFTRGFAMLLGLTLLIAYQEAPGIGIAWLVVIGLITLLRTIDHPRLSRILQGTLALTLLTTALLAVSFAIDHARQSLHPQLEKTNHQNPVFAYDVATTDLPSTMALKSRSAQGALEEVIVTAAANRRAPLPEGVQVQTGPGLPDWRWNTETLHWFGPVSRTQVMQLALLPPPPVRVLHALMAALVLFVTAALGYTHYVKRSTWHPPRWLSSLMPLALFSVLMSFQDVHAADIDRQLLEDLEKRLLEPPACLPACASVERVTIDVDDQNLNVSLRIHTGALLSVPLPGGLNSWMPVSVLEKGNHVRLARDTSGRLKAVFDAGIHDVVMQGPVQNLNHLELDFPLRPGTVSLKRDPAWQVAGLVDGRLPGGSLILDRLVQSVDTDTATLQQPPATPYVRLIRTVDFGFEWRVETQVQRIAPANGAMTVSIPLLPGESVLDSAMIVDNGIATVTFEHNTGTVGWTSTLPQTQSLDLTAGDLSERTEVWALRPGNLWHLSYTGVVPSKAPGSAGPVFHPYTGETLSVSVERTQPIAGPTVTVESVSLTLNPGERASTAELDIALRASEGGNYPVRLPEGAVVSGVWVNGVEQPIPLNDGTVTLPLIPGETSYQLNWRNEVAGGALFTSPDIDLASPANNINITTEFPRDRWVLLLGGPKLGPAMLFWGVLIVVILIGVALSRIPQLPLTIIDAVLLALGLTLCNLPTTLLVAAWFGLLLARERWVNATAKRWLKNSIQFLTAAISILAVFALVASVPLALLGSPEMQITGYGSSSYTYRWFSDHAGTTLPGVWVFSLPLWIYRGAMLLWSLWLVFALLRWMKWAWQRWSQPVGWFVKSVVTEEPG